MFHSDSSLAELGMNLPADERSARSSRDGLQVSYPRDNIPFEFESAVSRPSFIDNGRPVMLIADAFAT
jgi:hypothetical protein